MDRDPATGSKNMKFTVAFALLFLIAAVFFVVESNGLYRSYLPRWLDVDLSPETLFASLTRLGGISR